MIYVINYDRSKRKQLYAKLDALRQPFEIGANETKALNADKIILPDTNNLHFALRKLHFMNLHSALRMFPRPILGIGVGFLLMLKKCESKACFSFFPYEAEFNFEKEKWEIFDEENRPLNESYFVNGRYSGICNYDEATLNKALIDFINIKL